MYYYKQTDYYPFGAAFALDNTDKNKYLYGGKELQDEVLSGTQVGLYDFHARFLDGQHIPAWTSIDPLAEKYYNVSPYVYVVNNPVNAIDPNGEFVIFLPIIVPFVKALVTTVAAYTTYKAGEALIKGIRQEATANDKNAQQWRRGQERKLKREVDAKIGNVQESINNNVGKPSPDGTPDPKRSPKGGGKVALPIGTGAAVAKEAVNATEGGNTGNAEKMPSIIEPKPQNGGEGQLPQVSPPTPTTPAVVPAPQPVQPPLPVVDPYQRRLPVPSYP